MKKKKDDNDSEYSFEKEPDKDEIMAESSSKID